jgi:hypothetical protein
MCDVFHTFFDRCGVKQSRVCVWGGGSGLCVCSLSVELCVYLRAYIVVSGLYVYRETAVITSRASLKLPQSARLHGTTQAAVFQTLCQNILYYNSEIALGACQFWHQCNGASMCLTIQQLSCFCDKSYSKLRIQPLFSTGTFWMYGWIWILPGIRDPIKTIEKTLPCIVCA